jgi:hypothetical protein
MQRTPSGSIPVFARVCLLSLLAAVPLHAQVAQTAAAPEAKSAAAAESEASKEQCAAAYESAQESRAAGALKAAREQLQYCSRPGCPNFVHSDCVRWLGEVTREVPRVVLEAPPGAPSRVQIDGAEVAEPFAAQGIELDPGRHDLRWQQVGSAGGQRVLMLQQGVQDRRISLAPLTSAPEPTTPVSATRSQLNPWAFAAFGVGSVGLGAFAAFGLLARADNRALQAECPQQREANPEPGICLASDVDKRQKSINDKALAADVSLAVGAAGVASGLVLSLFFGDAPLVQTGSAGRGLQLAIDVQPQGATLRGRF